MKIIDAHVHVAPYVAGFTSRGELRSVGGGKASYATGEVFQMFPAEMGDFGVSPEAIIKAMDENGVEKAVLLQGNFMGFHNNYTYEAIKKYPDRFTGAATYDPFCLKVNDIRRRLFEATRPPVYLDGAVMNACYKHAQEKGLTVVLDLGKPCRPSWQVEIVSAAIRKYPDTKFVICHLLSPQKGDTELLKDALNKLVLPNVYFDISALASNQTPETFPYPSAVEHLKTAKSIVGADRLMFGTDMPCCLARDSYAHLKDYIINSGVFNSSELENIFYNTANKIYFNN